MKKFPLPDYAQGLFAKNLRRIRLEKQLTQEQVADLANTSPVWISGCERGVRNPSIRSLSQIAFALNVPMSDLLSNAKHAEPPEGKRVYSKTVIRKQQA